MRDGTEFLLIPSILLEDDRMKHRHLLMYGQIRAYASKKGYCWASNKTLADGINFSAGRSSQTIGDLIEWGYLNANYQTAQSKTTRYLEICDEKISQLTKEYRRSQEGNYPDFEKQEPAPAQQEPAQQEPAQQEPNLFAEQEEADKTPYDQIDANLRRKISGAMIESVALRSQKPEEAARKQISAVIDWIIKHPKHLGKYGEAEAVTKSKFFNSAILMTLLIQATNQDWAANQTTSNTTTTPRTVIIGKNGEERKPQAKWHGHTRRLPQHIELAYEYRADDPTCWEQYKQWCDEHGEIAQPVTSDAGSRSEVIFADQSRTSVHRRQAS